MGILTVKLKESAEGLLIEEVISIRSKNDWTDQILDQIDITSSTSKPPTDRISGTTTKFITTSSLVSFFMNGVVITTAECQSFLSTYACADDGMIGQGTRQVIKLKALSTYKHIMRLMQ